MIKKKNVTHLHKHKCHFCPFVPKWTENYKRKRRTTKHAEVERMKMTRCLLLSFNVSSQQFMGELVWVTWIFFDLQREKRQPYDIRLCTEKQWLHVERRCSLNADASGEDSQSMRYESGASAKCSLRTGNCWVCIPFLDLG